MLTPFNLHVCIFSKILFKKYAHNPRQVLTLIAEVGRHLQVSGSHHATRLHTWSLSPQTSPLQHYKCIENKPKLKIATLSESQQTSPLQKYMYKSPEIKSYHKL